MLPDLGEPPLKLNSKRKAGIKLQELTTDNITGSLKHRLDNVLAKTLETKKSFEVKKSVGASSNKTK